MSTRHFDRPAEHRHFEDVAGVAGNTCIEHGNSSTGVDGQTTVGVSEDPDICKIPSSRLKLVSRTQTISAYILPASSPRANFFFWPTFFSTRINDPYTCNLHVTLAEGT